MTNNSITIEVASKCLKTKFCIADERQLLSHPSSKRLINTGYFQKKTKKQKTYKHYTPCLSSKILQMHCFIFPGDLRKSHEKMETVYAFGGQTMTKVFFKVAY